MVAILLVLVAVWLCVRARRDRSRPYVEVRERRLIIYTGPRIAQEIEISLLAEVRDGWNKSILRLKDGRELAISHTGFSTGEEAHRFRRFVKEATGVVPA